MAPSRYLSQNTPVAAETMLMCNQTRDRNRHTYFSHCNFLSKCCISLPANILSIKIPIVWFGLFVFRNET